MRVGRLASGFGLELRILLLGLLVVAALWGLLALLDQAPEGSSQSLDELMLRSLRRPDEPTRPRGPVWLLHIARDASALGGYALVTLIAFAALGYLAVFREPRLLWLGIAAWGGAMLLDAAVRAVSWPPRAVLVSHLTDLSSPAFPGGHAVLSAASFLALGTLVAGAQKRSSAKIFLMVTSVALAILAGTSRVYLGVQYPTEVLAAWLVGLVWAVGLGVAGAAASQRRGE